MSKLTSQRFDIFNLILYIYTYTYTKGAIMDNKVKKDFMQVGYKILTRKKPKFPAKFTKEMKVNLYTTVMEYYESQQKYEYCTELSQSLNKIK